MSRSESRRRVAPLRIDLRAGETEVDLAAARVPQAAAVAAAVDAAAGVASADDCAGAAEALGLAALELAQRAHAAGLTTVGYLFETVALEASAEAATRKWPSDRTGG